MENSEKINITGDVNKEQELLQPVLGEKSVETGKHHVKLTIINNTSKPLKYIPDPWFESGGLAEGSGFKDLQPKESSVTDMLDNFGFAGCSGFVNFSNNHQVLTIAFSNPNLGGNKIGVGSTSHPKDVWEAMDKHYGHENTVEVKLSGVSCQFYNSGGSMNEAHVEFYDSL